MSRASGVTDSETRRTERAIFTLLLVHFPAWHVWCTWYENSRTMTKAEIFFFWRVRDLQISVLLSRQISVSTALLIERNSQMRKRLRGFQCWCGGREKIFAPAGNRTRSIHLVVSHLTRWSTTTYLDRGIYLLNLSIYYNFLLELIILNIVYKMASSITS